MAKFVYGPIVSDARNKIAGVVFSRSRSGPYGRSKVSPTQPRTSYQCNVRSGFASLAKLWGGTTMDTYRAGWVSLAARYPVKDRFGNTRILTGLQMFLKCNRALQAIDLPVLLAPPPNLIATAPGTLSVSAVAGTTTLVVTHTVNPQATEVPVVFAATPCGAGRLNVGSRYVQLAYLGAGHSSPWTSTTHYANRFGAWAVGQRISVEMFFTSNVSGAQGGRSAATCIST